MTAGGPAERVVVVGLGNPLLTDDAVGMRAAELLSERLAGSPVDVVQSAWGGMRFIDLLAGYDRAIIVDAIEWRRGPPGTIYRLTPDEAIPTLRAVSYHDVSLGTALALGRSLDIPAARRDRLLRGRGPGNAHLRRTADPCRSRQRCRSWSGASRHS